MITWFQPASQMEPLTPFLTYLLATCLAFLGFCNALCSLSLQGFYTCSFFRLGCPLYPHFPSPIYLSLILWIQGQWDLLGEVLPEQPSFQ